MSPTAALSFAPQAAARPHRKGSKNKTRRNSAVVGAQKQPKAEEQAIVFNGSTLASDSTALEKEGERLPSTSIHIIPNNGRYVSLTASWRSSEIR